MYELSCLTCQWQFQEDNDTLKTCPIIHLELWLSLTCVVESSLSMSFEGTLLLPTGLLLPASDQSQKKRARDRPHLCVVRLHFAETGGCLWKEKAKDSLFFLCVESIVAVLPESYTNQ